MGSVGVVVGRGPGHEVPVQVSALDLNLAPALLFLLTVCLN